MTNRQETVGIDLSRELIWYKKKSIEKHITRQPPNTMASNIFQMQQSNRTLQLREGQDLNELYILFSLLKRSLLLSSFPLLSLVLYIIL